jgi:ATP-dependent DNA helicase PIF1
VFKRMLDRLRMGKCRKSDLEKLHELMTTQFPEDIKPTRLYAINKYVDEVNNAQLNALIESGANGVQNYQIKFGGNAATQKSSREYVDSVKLQKEIQLCDGAQVMLTRNINIEAGLVNGARGVVHSTLPNAVYVRFMSGEIVKVDMYKVMPLDKLINITYMPLQLAWAISIHKSQGMTLDAVEMDLGPSIFACGQGYTALSRAKNMKSIKIISVVPSSFRTSTLVKEFYDKISVHNV